MKASTGQKIKIGLFTILGIILFIVGIFFIGSKKNMFGNTYMLYGTFKNVGGLEVGNNIQFAGINVGTVENIKILSDTLIRVEMRMKEEVMPFIKTDALATIGSDGLMGDKLITIVSGSAQKARLLTSGSRIMTVNPVSFDKVLNRFTSVVDNADIITTELANMAIQIRTGNGTISKLLYTDSLSRSLEATAKNAANITSSLAGVVSHIQSGKGSLGSLVYTDSLSNKLEVAVTSANATIQGIEQAADAIKDAADGINENMKALHGTIFFRGYYKRKAREAELATSVSDTLQIHDTDSLERKK